MDVDIGVKRIKLSLMNSKELIGEIAEEDRTSAIVGELVGTGTADAKGRVGAFGLMSLLHYSCERLEADR